MKIKISLIIFLIFTLTSCVNLNNYNHSLQPKPKGELRIATYNVNWGSGIRPIREPEKTIKAIKATHADIVLLQETTPFWQKLMNKQLRADYPYRQFNHSPSAGGLAILSKYPFKTLDYHHPRIGWHPVWILRSQSPIGPVQLVNVHLTPPLVSEGNMGLFASAVFTSKGVRLQEMKYIHKVINHHLPTILAGDFNEGDIGRAVKYLERNSFIDAWNNNGLKQHTWEWQVGPLNFRDRFDRVFYTPSLRLTNLQVLHQGSSDHYPVIADFRLKKN